MPFSTDLDLMILYFGVEHSVLTLSDVVAIDCFRLFDSILGAWDLFLFGGFEIDAFDP